MHMKTRLKGVVMKDGKARLWPGIPLGIGVTYLAGKVMPDFAVENNYLYGLVYSAPAAILGALMLLSPKTRQAGYGTLIGAAGYYVWALGYNEATKGSSTPVEGAPVQILG
jgi:hypothetical protein